MCVCYGTQVLAALQSGNLAVMSASGGPSTSSQLGIRPLHDSSQLGIRPLHDPTLRSTGPAPATVWPTASDDPTQQQPVDGPLSGMQQLALAAASVGGAVTPGAHAPQVPVLPWPQHFTQMPFTAGVGGPISAAKREQQSSDTPLEMSGGTGTGQTRSHSHSQGGSRGAAGSGGSADGGAGPSRGGARGARQARHDPHLATALEGSLLAPDFARAAAVGASGDVVMGSDGPRSEDPDAAGGGDEGGGGGSGSGGMSDDSSGRAFKRSRDTGRAMQPGEPRALAPESQPAQLFKSQASIQLAGLVAPGSTMAVCNLVMCVLCSCRRNRSARPGSTSCGCPRAPGTPRSAGHPSRCTRYRAAIAQ